MSPVIWLVIFVALLGIEVATMAFAKKYINGDITRTNADSLIGKQARVTSEVDNRNATGSAVINGQEWMARSVRDEEVIQEGTIVTVKEIQGVKLIVEAEA